MRMFAPIVAFALSVILSGCASNPGKMSSKDCSGADWRALGMEDGLAGAHSTRREQRFAACAEASIAADSGAYDAGYRAGLEQFCTPRGGFEFGLTGEEYVWVCDSDSEPAFIHAYQVGIGEHELKTALREAQRNMDRVEREMRNAQNEVQRLQAQYNHANSADRIRLQNDVNKLRRRVFSLQDERAQLQYEQDRAQTQLKDYREGRPPIPGVD